MRNMMNSVIWISLVLMLTGTAAWADSSWWQGVDTSDWYAFDSTGTTDPGEIGLDNWHGVAGEHGRPMRDGDRFKYDNKPIKFWGFNLGGSEAALSQEEFDEMVPFYAKYGVNMIRYHKMLEHWSPLRPTEGPHNFWLLDESPGGGMERFDYGTKKLKDAGIYLNFSPSWHIALSEGDKADVPYWEEFFDSYGGNPDHPNRPFVSTDYGYGSIPAHIYFLDEFQELKIKQIENLLNHVNVYTGVKYADEPQLVMVEMHNETSIYHIDSCLKNGWMTTLRERACQQFCDFLRTKYASHAELEAAWNPGQGQNGLDYWTTLEDNTNTVYPEQGFPNQKLHLDNIPPVMLPNSPDDAHPGRWARARDTSQFYFQVERAYYRRFLNRIRATGYDGEIIASNWGASGYLNHYLNLNADWDVGMIDRHGAYMSFSDRSMLSVPGCEFLAGSSKSQTATRPYMVSEWCQSWANPFTIESRVIMAAYGFGLQGVDAATQLPGGNIAAINDVLQFDNQYFNPQVAALYPFILRQVHRGDISEGSVTAERPVHLPTLRNNFQVGFDDHSDNEFGLHVVESDKIHRRTPAVAKCMVRYTDSYVEEDIFPIDDYREIIGSDTYYDACNGQLSWREGHTEIDGNIIINSPGTQGAIGFFEQYDIIDLDDVKIQLLNPGTQFGAVIVTSKKRWRNLANDDEILVLAVARARNTGMQYDVAGKVTNEGTGPVLMEPVKARVWFKRTGTMTVNKLDHDGMLGGGKWCDQNNKSFTVDGANDQTPYYKVTIEEITDTPPNVYFTSPANGATVDPDFSVAVNANDENGINRVIFYIDGQWQGADTTAPYTWDFIGLADGEHEIRAMAKDNNNNTANAYRTVMVDSGSSGGGENIVINPEFDQTLVEHNSYWVSSDDYAGDGWVVYSAPGWTRHTDGYAYVDAATQAGNKSMIQFIHDHYQSTGMVPLSFDARHMGSSVFSVKIWGVNESCRANILDANPPRGMDWGYPGVLLYENTTLGNTEYDWKPIGDTLNLGASGYEYLVIKVYSSGIGGTDFSGIDGVVIGGSGGGPDPVLDGGFETSAFTGGGGWIQCAQHADVGWVVNGNNKSKWNLQASGDYAWADNSGAPNLAQIITDNGQTTGTREFAFDAKSLQSGNTLDVYIYGVQDDVWGICLYDDRGPRRTDGVTVNYTELLHGVCGGANTYADWTTLFDDVNFGAGYKYIAIVFKTGGVGSGETQQIDNVRIQ